MPILIERFWRSTYDVLTWSMWAPLDAPLFCAEADARAVAASAGRVAIDLDQHGVIDIGAEGLLNRFKVGPVAVAGKLHPVGQPIRQIGYEHAGRVAVATADQPRRDQLCVRVDRGPSPDIASLIRRGLGRGDVALLAVNEAPNFIHLERLQVRPRNARSWYSLNARPASSSSLVIVFLLAPVRREIARRETPSAIIPRMSARLAGESLFMNSPI